MVTTLDMKEINNTQAILHMILNNSLWKIVFVHMCMCVLQFLSYTMESKGGLNLRKPREEAVLLVKQVLRLFN